MPNWNRLLVEDAFKVQPGGINYYRDLFLLRPFLGFSIGATSCLIEPKFSAHRIEGLKWAFCAGVVLLLAKEKRILIIVAPTYIFIRMAILIIFVHTREVLLWALLSGVALFALFRSRLIRE